MAWTQADLDKLDSALANGGAMQSIAFAEQTFVFRSIDEMLKLRSVMAASLTAAAGASTSHRLAATSKGV